MKKYFCNKCEKEYKPDYGLIDGHGIFHISLLEHQKSSYDTAEFQVGTTKMRQNDSFDDICFRCVVMFMTDELEMRDREEGGRERESFLPEGHEMFRS